MRTAVVPAYNEENSIGEVVHKLYKYVSTVVVIDDCSTDQTKNIATSNGAYVLSNSTNLGYENTLIRGLAFASSLGASAILTFDADGQHPYAIINKMFGLIESGNSDIVVGTRSSLPRISEKLFSLYTRVRYGVADILCGMKCYSITAINATGICSEWDSVGSYITIKAYRLNLRVTPVPIQQLDRYTGISRFGISMKSELKIINAFFKSLTI